MAERRLLVRASRVRSFGPAQLPRHADTVLIENGRIAAVGPFTELEGRVAGAATLELPGATLTPGLTDAHIHVTEWAVARRRLELGATGSPDAAAQLVATAGTDPGGWIRGRGWSLDRWHGVRPHHRLLDDVMPETPVALQSHDMHALWVNGAAMRAAGIDAGTGDPAGGRIERDETGEPTGLLLENAAALIAAVLPVPSFGEVRDAVLEAQAELHQFGFTGIHSLPGIHMPEPTPQRVLDVLRDDHALRLRALAHLPLDDLDAAIDERRQSGDGGEWIRTGAVKMFLDGTLGSRTAWMREPYEDGSGCGVRVLEPDAFHDAAARAARAGIAATVHAIGDAAVGLAIDTLADPALRVAALPHRIEHVQCLRSDHMTRLRDIICSVQPCHLINDWSAADRFWGERRTPWTFAFRAMLDAGATLAFGSDAPVEPVDPRLGLHAATARTDLAGEPAGGWQPEQRISRTDALRAYTWGPTVAAAAAGELGEIAPGRLADLAAWDADPTDVEGDALLRLCCVATIVGGDIVHGG